MSSRGSLAERIRRTAEELPHEKQQEVYDFAAYLKSRSRARRSSGSSLREIVGSVEGPRELAANHDRIYD